MANPNPNFFYFYRRYKWRSVDFTAFQALMTDIDRGMMEGAHGGAVLKGFEVTPPTGASLVLSVNPGIGVGPSGFFHAVTGVTQVSVNVPVSGNVARRSLLVLRPQLTDNNTITSPTTPFTNVPLNQFQGSQILMIDGTDSATPDYPASGANDVVLAGLMLTPGQTQLFQRNLDFEVRSVIGKNSLHQKSTFRYDDRVRPYRASFKLVGVKPSQGSQTSPQLFTFAGSSSPSIYPKTAGGLYNGAAGDSFYDFSTGAITGADQASAAFSPTIPTAGNSIVALLGLKPDSTVSVKYGVQGTYAQCVAAIQNQTADGSAGSVTSDRSLFKLAYVIVTSISGAISDIQVIDARSIGGGGSGGGGGGMSGDWNADGATSPIQDVENGEKVWLFDVSDAGTQKLTRFIKVPQSYNPPNQIKLWISQYSPSATGTQLLKALASLVRKDTDAAGSTANQRNTTNTALSNAVANQYRQVSLDITDVNGQINGVSVNPGDMIRVDLTRGTDTDTADIRLVPSATEATFS